MKPKVPTEFSFGIGMVNTKKYRPIPTEKYRPGITQQKSVEKNHPFFDVAKRSTFPQPPDQNSARPPVHQIALGRGIYAEPQHKLLFRVVRGGGGDF